MENLLHNKYVLIGGAAIAALAAFMYFKGNSGGGSAQASSGGYFPATTVYGSGISGAIDNSPASTTDLGGTADPTASGGLDAATNALLGMQTHQIDTAAAVQTLQINSDQTVNLARINSDTTLGLAATNVDKIKAVAPIYNSTLQASKGLKSINASVGGVDISINNTSKAGFY